MVRFFEILINIKKDITKFGANIITSGKMDWYQKLSSELLTLAVSRWP